MFTDCLNNLKLKLKFKLHYNLLVNDYVYTECRSGLLASLGNNRKPSCKHIYLRHGQLQFCHITENVAYRLGCFFHLITMNGDSLHIPIGPQQHYLNQWCEFRAGYTVKNCMINTFWPHFVLFFTLLVKIS